MIGRQPLPAAYADWNEYWGAPFGRPAALGVPLHQRLTSPDPKNGPFALQITSGTRTFEFPWAYFTAGAGTGSRILEIGGGMSGLRYVWATEGAQVVVADPNAEGSGAWPPSMPFWPVDTELNDTANRAFGTDVRMIPKSLAEADLEPDSFDRVACLSVVEHLSLQDGRDLLARAAGLLVPGGLLLVTADLFLDLLPFGVLPANGYGTNVDLFALTSGLGMELVQGDARELYGFPDFDRDRVVEHLEELFMSPNYPSVPQAFALRKRG